MREKLGKVLFTVGSVIIFLTFVGFVANPFLDWPIPSDLDLVLFKWGVIFGASFLIIGTILRGFKGRELYFSHYLVWIAILILGWILFLFYYFLYGLSQ